MANSELQRRSRTGTGVGRKLIKVEKDKLRQEHVKFVQDNVLALPLAMACIIILYIDNYVELRMSTNPAADRDTVGID